MSYPAGETVSVFIVENIQFIVGPCLMHQVFPGMLAGRRHIDNFEWEPPFFGCNDCATMRAESYCKCIFRFMLFTQQLTDIQHPIVLHRCRSGITDVCIMFPDNDFSFLPVV